MEESGCIVCKWTLLLLFAVTLCVSGVIAQRKSFIDWHRLRNPILFYPDWSIKDAAMAYRAGKFYVFFSAFYTEKEKVRSHVVEVSTRDFKHFSQPIINFDGEEDGWIGMCSPDVQRLRGKYVMTFNSWGDKSRQTQSALLHDLKRPCSLVNPALAGPQSDPC